MPNNVPTAAEPSIPNAGANGQIDIAPIIAKIQVPPNLKSMFDKMILSGMRIMFDKGSHKMMLEQLDGPGPMTKKLSEGMITLMYMLWTQSNKTLPPNLMIPATVVLTLKAFDFLQKTNDPEATKEVLGEVMHAAVMGVMERFGVTEQQLQQAANKNRGAVPRAPTGLLGAK